MKGTKESRDLWPPAIRRPPESYTMRAGALEEPQSGWGQVGGGTASCLWLGNQLEEEEA